MMIESEIKNNPLDVVENLAASRPWLYERKADNQLQLFLEGEWADYDLSFNWSSDLSCLHLIAVFGAHQNQEKHSELCALITHINTQLWFGFFALKDNYILFRHSHLFIEGVSSDSCEALVEIARAALDRWGVAFYLMAGGYSINQALLALQKKGAA